MKQEKDEMPSGVYRSWGFREIKRRRQEEGRIWDVSEVSLFSTSAFVKTQKLALRAQGGKDMQIMKIRRESRKKQADSSIGLTAISLLIMCLVLFFSASVTWAEVAYSNLWTRQLDSGSWDEGNAVAVDSANNVYLAGFTFGSIDGNVNQGDTDVLLVKYDKNGVKLWTKQWGTSKREWAYGLAVDGQGNAYVVGLQLPAGTGGYYDVNGDLFVVKYDTNGNLLWTIQRGTPYYDEAVWVAVDNVGNLYVVGNTVGDIDGNTNAGDVDIFLMKYDTNGNRLWTRQRGTATRDDVLSVALDGSGNVYLTGWTNGALDGNTNAGESDIFLMKYDTNGNRLWTRQRGTATRDEAGSVALDGNGNAYLTGYTHGGLDGNTNAGESDLFLIKYDSNGNWLWTKQRGTSYVDVSGRMALDGNGNAYLTGYTHGGLDGNTNAGESDLFLIKYDSNGNWLWTKQRGTATRDEAQGGVAVDGDGNAYVTGMTTRVPGHYPFSYDIFLMKFGQRYRFVVMADSRSDPNQDYECKFTCNDNNVDSAKNTCICKPVLERIMGKVNELSPQPSFILFGGDLVFGPSQNSGSLGGMLNQFTAWKQIVNSIMDPGNTRTPSYVDQYVYPAFGSHEGIYNQTAPNKWDAFRDSFNPTGSNRTLMCTYYNGTGLPTNCQDRDYKRTVYYCNYDENDRFFVLNNDYDPFPTSVQNVIGDCQRQWVTNNLVTNGKNFFIHHVPAYPATEGYLLKDSTQIIKRNEYIDLLLSNNATMIFSGHEHQYTRRLIKYSNLLWSVAVDSEQTWVDSQGENGRGINAIDDNTGSIWHTRYNPSTDQLPHKIDIDLGRSYTINGFSYTPRQDGSANGRIKDYEFYVSDDGINWGDPVVTGEFANDATTKVVTFPSRAGRHTRLKAITEVNNNPWTSAAEFGLDINYSSTTQFYEIKAGKAGSPVNSNPAWDKRQLKHGPNTDDHFVVVDVDRTESGTTGVVVGGVVYGVGLDGTRYCIDYFTQPPLTRMSDGRFPGFFTDSDKNGRPDDCGSIAPTFISAGFDPLDVDNDGIPNLDDLDTAVAPLAIGGGNVAVDLPEDQHPGIGLSAVDTYLDTDSSIEQDNKPINTEFPFGLINFAISGINPKPQVTVTLTFPSSVPTYSTYWAYDPAEGWYTLPIGSNNGDQQITITLTDGGAGDADGETNRAIRHLGGIATLKPEIINNLVSFKPITIYGFTPDVTGCAPEYHLSETFAGKYSFDARLKNISGKSLYNLKSQVKTLTGGNLLQNADGGPSGVGSVLTIPKKDGYADGLLNPGEFVDVPFVICLKQRTKFSFYVDVLGVGVIMDP